MSFAIALGEWLRGNSAETMALPLIISHKAPLNSPVTDQPLTSWFKYIVRVQPHHTDYAGVVWHGTYLTWMEAARVECLRSANVDYAELVAMGCDLPVIDLALRYHRAVKMGREISVNTCLREVNGVRLVWDYQIQSMPDTILHLSGKVTLVSVNRDNGKIMRRLPSQLQEAIALLLPKT